MNGMCMASNTSDCSAMSDVCNIGQCDQGTGQCIKVPRAGGCGAAALLYLSDCAGLYLDCGPLPVMKACPLLRSASMSI